MIAKFSYSNQINRIPLIVASGLSRRVKNLTSSSEKCRRDFIMLSASRIATATSEEEIKDGRQCSHVYVKLSFFYIYFSDFKIKKNL